ncbi:hypothetical protein AVEN_265345-1 [Araneus ventricosus]|uniref:Uncharacterized protein n=1 Tax=Araneus ventricosus TaxID=182803 RepID=A0A4Y2RBL9_ARAVE|nr:hypothetical protein AVEN_265345-1 [Araneus ventricosus]
MCYWKHLQEIDVCASASVTCVTGTPAAADVGEAQWQFSTADRFFQASVRVQAPTVLYTLLMESCRPISNRSARIGVCARFLRQGESRTTNMWRWDLLGTIESLASSSGRGSKLRGPSQNSPRVPSERDVIVTKLN